MGNAVFDMMFWEFIEANGYRGDSNALGWVDGVSAVDQADMAGI